MLKSAIVGAVLLFLGAAPARATTFTLSVSTSGPAGGDGVVTSTPGGIVCPPTCSASFTSGSTVTLGEVVDSTVAFSAWGGANGCRTNLQTCNLTMSGNKVVAAAFDPTVDVSIFGSGLGVVSSSAGVVCDRQTNCANSATVRYIYPKGSTVVLTESTGTASSFTGWTGDGGCNTASTCTITLNGYEHIIATFTALGTTGISSFTIRVVVPNGGGYVTSTPAGLDCGVSTHTACAFGFSKGTSVKLATAAASGYRFAGWSQAGCSGHTTACVITSTSPLQGVGGIFSPWAYFYKNP